MLNTNRPLKRLVSVSLALLLLLLAGCGSAPAPAEDTPAPTQAPATPTPSAEQPPEPTAAASPTDVNAPAVQLPAPEISIERKVPDSLQFLTGVSSFTLTNAEGQTLTRSGSEASGTMEFTHQQLSDASGNNVFLALIPYSSSFSCEPDASSGSGDWGFEIVGPGSTAYSWCHCVVKGSGRLESFEYNAGGQLIVCAEPGAKLELTLPMPDSGLGESGWIRLHLTAGESEVSLTAEGSDFSFSGVDTGAPVLLDYGGIYSAEGLDLAPESSSGSVLFGTAANGAFGFTVS